MAIINAQVRSSVPNYTEKSYAVRRERLLPIFILEIVTENTSKASHCNQEFIRNRLHDAPYCLDMDRRTVSRCLSALLDEDLSIFGNAKDGYWYDSRGYCKE